MSGGDAGVGETYEDMWLMDPNSEEEWREFSSACHTYI